MKNYFNTTNEAPATSNRIYKGEQNQDRLVYNAIKQSETAR